MAKGGYTSMWKTVLQIAIAVMLIIGGLNVFINAGTVKALFDSGDPLVTAVSRLFNRGTLRDIIIYVLAAIELIAGVLLVLDMFKIKQIDRLDDIFVLIIMVCWVLVFVILGDIVPFFKGQIKFLPFLVALAKDAVMVAALGIIKAKI